MRLPAGGGVLGGITILLRKPLRGLLLSTAGGIREGAQRRPRAGSYPGLFAPIRDTSGETPAGWERRAERRSGPVVGHSAVLQPAGLRINLENSTPRPASALQ